IEKLYLDAVSAQARFLASIEQMESARISYELSRDQFSAGFKNTVDLLTEKNKFMNARQEYLKAKFTAILDIKLLDFYQGIPIKL
ncbi:MAG: TolC family protein, partial [Bacteroidetes bacterium]|nr:TolC family protein [Bacteroidota bacterium]